MGEILTYCFGHKEKEVCNNQDLIYRMPLYLKQGIRRNYFEKKGYKDY